MSDHALDFSLTGKTVLVTGASRGIGRAIALACAASGADVVFGARRAGDVAEAVDTARALARRAIAAEIDLLDLDGARRGIAEAHERMGRIDVLVNNVGIGPENLAVDVTEKDFDYTVDVNLKGTFFVTQAVGRLMIAQGAGRVIMISSQAGTVVLKGEAIYCMSKAALNHLTRCLAVEWAPHGITVNSVSPTFVATDGTAAQLADAAFRRQVVEHIPLGRIGEMMDVAGAVVFLASPAAALVTGIDLRVDGGWAVA